jgi:lysylphosphatidylglycerol synthetase-like protein (DUF2156 family)
MQASVVEIVRAHGGAVSHGLLDPRCRHFRVPRLEGLIGYRRWRRCAVAIGEPVCAPEDVTKLAESFRDFCRRRGWDTLYAAADARFGAWAIENGYAAIHFGDTLIVDPRIDPERGPAARHLRQKVNHTRRSGVVVEEYRPAAKRDPALEHAMGDAVVAWLRAREGLQIFLGGVRLFADRLGRRWFHARHRDRIVGVLSMVHLGKRNGSMLNAVMVRPEAPVGTSELLVVSGLAALRREGASFATFGIAPRPSLGRIVGLGARSAWLARTVYRTSVRLFDLDGRSLYWEKYAIARREESFVLLQPPRLTPGDAFALLRAFNARA